MADARVERLAEVLVDYSTSVAPGQLVLLETTPLATPWLQALYRRVLAAGGHPHARSGLSGVAETLLEQGTDEHPVLGGVVDDKGAGCGGAGHDRPL